MEITLKKRMRIRFSIFLDIGIELKKRTCVRMINLQEPKCRWKHIVCKIKKMDLSQKRSWTLLIDNITNYHLNILYIRFFMAQNVLFEVTITYNYFLISFSVENIAYRRIWHAETLPAFFYDRNKLVECCYEYTACLFSWSNEVYYKQNM